MVNSVMSSDALKYFRLNMIGLHVGTQKCTITLSHILRAGIKIFLRDLLYLNKSSHHKIKVEI